MAEDRAPAQALETLPVALALALPLGAYATVPLAGLSLAAVLLPLAAGATLYLWRIHRLVRPPFEYWWPVVAALGLGALAILRGTASGLPAYLPGAACVLLAPGTLCANGTVACRALVVLGLATGLLALMQAAAELAWIPPTVVFVPGDLLLAGPDSISAVVLLLLCGLAANVIVLIHPGFTAFGRRCGLAALAPIVIAIGYLLSREQVFSTVWRPVYWPAQPAAATLMAGLALWLAARIAARSLLLAWRNRELRRLVAPIALGVLVAGHLGAGERPGFTALFFLGLVAALEAPWTVHRPARARHLVWAIPALCVAVQLTGVEPLAAHDPRNQRANAERMLAAGDWDGLHGVLDSLLKRRPADPAYTLLRARAYIRQDWPGAAVSAYRAAPRPEAESAAVPAGLEQAFFNGLRDASSAQKRGAARFYFERALVHKGDLEQVRDLLEIRRGAAKSVAGTIADVDTLARTLEILLGAAPGALALDGWSAADLAAVLEDGGARIRRFPEGVPDNTGPWLCHARIAPRGLAVMCVPAGASMPSPGGIQLLPLPARSDAVPPMLRWADWYRQPDGTWTSTLRAGDEPVLSVTAGEGTIEIVGDARIPRTAEYADTVLWVPVYRRAQASCGTLRGILYPPRTARLYP